MSLKVLNKNFITRLVKGFERVCLKWPFFRETYGRLFYQGVIKKETKLSGLKNGDKVLHIGSGSMPFTAIALSEMGLRVVALDNDVKAVENSFELIQSIGKAEKIEVRVGDGCYFDYSGFKGIWISLHVYPREKIIRRAVSQMNREACLVVREPRNWLARFYPRLNPESIGFQVEISRFPQAFGKETIIIKKD